MRCRSVWHIRLALAGALLNASPASAKEDKQVVALLAMTPKDFADRVSVKDDELEPAVVMTTANGFQYKVGLFKQVTADVFLRAFLDRKTLRARYQIYYSVTYQARSWAFIEQANYIGSKGLETQPVVKIASDVSCGRYGCSFVETVGVDISEDDLRWLASRYQPATDNPMKVRFKTKASGDVETSILPAEAAGLLQRIDAYTVKVN